MESLLFNTDPIKLNKAGGVAKQHKDYEPLFNNLQGNILTEHGRDYTVHMLLQFKDRKAVRTSAIKKVIAKFVKNITSATKQHHESAEYRNWMRHCEGEQPNHPFVNFLLSAQGYKRLDIPDDRIPSDPSFQLSMREERHWKNAFPEWGQSLTAPTIQSLKNAKEKGRRAYLIKAKKRGLQQYEERVMRENPKSGGQHNEWDDILNKGVDAMIIIAMDKAPNPTQKESVGRDDRSLPQALHALAEKFTQFFESVASVYCDYEQYGVTYYNKADRRRQLGKEDRKPIEHFGFIDGISNPLFLEKDVERAKETERIQSFNKYNPWAPLSLVLVREPKGKPYEFGSYMVFLKLEQNVKAFHSSMQKFAKRLNISVELAEAFMFGRFRDGTPVALSSTSGLNDPIPNNFKYTNDLGTDDVEGLRCPLHSHMRKVNRRDFYRETRIVRRGLTYGRRSYQYDDTGNYFKFNDEPIQGVGLLFMCFQADIGNQFGRIVGEWAGPSSPRCGIGFDPIIGQINGRKGKLGWRNKWGPNPDAKLTKLPFPVKSFITSKSGEYFFAPSISFLKRLGATTKQREEKDTCGPENLAHTNRRLHQR